MRKNKNQYNEKDPLLEGGEEAAAEDPPKEPSKKASSKKASSKKKEEEKKQEDSDDDPYSPPVKEECCCCMCVCATEFTKDTTCCLCFPIKCGAVFIAVFTLVVTVMLFLWNYWLFLNEYIHWWYTMVCLFILCPLLVGANFSVSWLIKDTRTTRSLLWTSQLLALITVILLAIWQIAYFIGIYKKENFYQGQGDINSNEYYAINKKVWIVIMLGETIVLAAFFGYFMAVTGRYQECCRGPQDDEAAPEEEGAADDENKDDNKDAEGK